MPAVARRPRRIVHQKAKGPIDPLMGQRVRELRTARGMTQAKLAGQDFTKGFISLVETGRTRMSLRAAEIVAGRLGVSVAELLDAGNSGGLRELELHLTRAEGRAAAGEWDEALELLASLAGKMTGRLAARAVRLKGRVLTGQRKAREAIGSLDDALRAFRGIGDREMVARVLFDLALAHAQLGQHGEAVNLALQCDYALSAGHVVDRTLELRVHTLLASEFVAIGDLGSADIRAERAQQMAQDVVDPLYVASSYETLAYLRQQQGDLEAALAYSRRALDSYQEMHNAAAVGSTWNTIGWVYVKRGQLKRAAEALDTAERLANERGDQRLMSFVLQSKAELAMARGDHQEAIALAQSSINHPEASDRARAISHLVKAEALARSGAPLAKVNAAFAEAINALEPQGRGLVARAHRAHFEALNARGEAKQATAAAQKALELLSPALA